MFLSKRLLAIDCLDRPRGRTCLSVPPKTRLSIGSYSKVCSCTVAPNLANMKSSTHKKTCTQFRTIFLSVKYGLPYLSTNENPAFTISHSAFGVTSVGYAGGKKKCVVLVHDEESRRLILAASIPVGLGAKKQGMLLALGLTSGIYVLT